jgi:pimeloyl-ACP methyl ester carboxylesterase
MTAPITTRDVGAGDYSFHVSTSGDPSATPIVFLHGSGPGVTALTGGPVVFDHDYLAAIDHPVLLIHGRDDTFIPYAASVYFLDNLPNADLHVLARAGHWAQVEQPERFRSLVRGFVGAAATIRTETAS